MTTATCPEQRACRVVEFKDYSTSLTELLDSIGAPAVLARQSWRSAKGRLEQLFNP